MSRRMLAAALAVVVFSSGWVLAGGPPVARSTDPGGVAAAPIAAKAGLTAAVSAIAKIVAPSASPFGDDAVAAPAATTSDDKGGGSIILSNTLAVPGTYATLQAAITAAVDGDTIIIAAGTYTEVGQIAITKNLVIRGAGAATTIIKPDADYAAGWWTVAAGKSLVLRGVTLDCAGKVVNYGVVNDGTGAVRECVLKNIRAADYVGIAIESHGNLDVTGCTFQNIERVGVRATNSTCTIGGNVFLGKGSATPNLNYFLEIRSNCNIGIYNNRISDCSGVASGIWGSCAIQAYSDWPVFQQTTVSIKGNTIRNCGGGVVFGTYDATDTTIGTLAYNDLSGTSDYALWAASTVAAVAENNYWNAAGEPQSGQVVTTGTDLNDVVYTAPSPDTDPWLLNGQIQMAAGGARLVEKQYTDGSWGWPLDAPPTYGNIIGPIGMGLVQAHRAAPSAATTAALAKVSAYLLAKTNTFSPSDGYLAAELDAVLGVTTHVAYLQANFYAPLAAGTYNKSGLGTEYNTAGYINLIRTGRAGAYANMGAWDVGMGLAAAHACGADTTAWIAGTQAEVNELNLGYYNVIGLAGALYGLKTAGAEFDPTAGLFASANSLSDLAAALAGFQLSTGGFAWESDYVIESDDNETIQETAYSVLALSQFGGYRAQIVKAVRYLASVQLATGGWQNYPGSGENNEITGEALWGIAAGNRLSLDAEAPSLYVKQGASVHVDMNVANLLQEVKACQAILGYSSSFFEAGAGAIIAGGGAWDDLIYTSWSTAGKLDTAVGVYGESSTGAGTDVDGTVAKITLTVKPTAPDGITQMVFRTDVDCNSTRVECTYLSDMNAMPVFPSKRNSVNIHVDSTPPTVDCPDNVSVNADTGACQATNVSIGMATADDASPIVSITNDHASTTYPVGTTTVTWTATDAAGNSATCTQTVTVIDAQDPTITCPANISVDAAAGTCAATVANLGAPTTADNCGVSSVSNDHPSTTFPVGVTSVVWTVTDTAGRTAICTQTVTVLDTQKPIITSCGANASASADALCKASVPNMTAGVTATDNCTAPELLVITQAPAAGTLVGKGVTNVTITVQDASGNAETCAKTFTVTDMTPPTITLNGGAEISIQCHLPYTELGAVATDNCDETVSVTIGGDTVDTDVLGTYVVTYDAMDAASNTATQVIRTVTVTEPNPTISGVPLPLTVECTGGGGALKTNPAIVAFLAAPTVVDGCDSDATLVNDAPEFFPLGGTLVTWTASDPDTGAFVATASQTVTVVDTTAPVFGTCPSSPATIPVGANCKGLIPDLVALAAASDGCGGSVVITQDPLAGAEVGPGMHTVTLTAADAASNTSTCLVSVTVADTTAPVIAGCPANITQAADTGTCGAAVSWTPPTASDNCAVTQFTSNFAPGDTFPKGLTTVTYTAKDAADNSVTCSFTVTVTDTQPPVIVCPGNQTLVADAACSALVPAITPTTLSDNCTSVSFVQSPAAGSPVGLGDTTITLTATDGAALTATCTLTLTVVDQTAPVITSASAAPTCVGTGNVTITATATDCGSTPSWSYSLDNATWLPGLIVPGAELVEGLNTIHVKATDTAGNSSQTTVSVTKDITGPAISAIAASQGTSPAVNVLCGQGEAGYGAVDIYITATDAGCNVFDEGNFTGVDVAGISAATYVDKSGSVYHFQVTVTSATAHGAHVITVNAVDDLGNATVDNTASICVVNRMITGTVSYATLVPSTGYTVTRDVVFKATNASGAVVKTWTIPLDFTNAAGVATSVSYTLTGVPATTVAVSAKTAWHLRQRLTGVAFTDGVCAGKDFVLKGGDLDNSNSVNILDYTRMKTKWLTNDAAADVNGDGSVYTADYSLMKANWFVLGDAQ